MARPLISLAFFLVACAGADKGGRDPEPASFSGEAAISAEIPTVVTVSWSAPRQGQGLVEYGLDGALDQSTPADGVEAREHSVVVRGLKAGRVYDLRPVTVTADGERLYGDTITVELEPPPASASLFTISDYDPDRAAPGGYVLTALMEADESWVVILDRDGDLVWYRRADEGLGVVTARFVPERDSVVWAQHDIDQSSDLGGIVRQSFDGSESVLTRALLGHHDFVPLPNDRYAWIAVQARDVEIDGEPMSVAADMILEAPEGATDEDEPREVFSFFEDYHDLYVPCSHFWEPVYGTGGYDFSHGNSLVYDEATDQLRFMAKNLDNLLFLDRATGAVVAEMGGVHGTIATADPAEMWTHGHYSQIWEDGFTVFDNNYHSETFASRANEYRYDLESGALELVWSYTSEGGRFNALLGDVKRIGDTRLVSWTEFGMLTEVDDEGEVVWRAETELGTGLGRATWVESLYNLETESSF